MIDDDDDVEYDVTLTPVSKRTRLLKGIIVCGQCRGRNGFHKPDCSRR